jgi:hypothetical protein
MKFWLAFWLGILSFGLLGFFSNTQIIVSNLGQKWGSSSTPTPSSQQIVYPTLERSLLADPQLHQSYLDRYGIQLSEYRNLVRAWFNEQLNKLREQERGARIDFQLRFGENFAYEWRWRSSFQNQQQASRIQNFFNNLEEEAQNFFTKVILERGFIYENASFFVDYPRMVAEANTVLSQWVQQFTAELQRRNLNRDQALRHVLQFCQKIPYSEFPVWDGERFIVGFYPPNFLLANQLGDCDMKSVLFAVIWERMFPGHTALILTSNHMFAAVKGFARERSTHSCLRINGEEFLCLEPTGEALTPPGELAKFSLDALQAGDYRIIYPLSQ